MILAHFVGKENWQVEARAAPSGGSPKREDGPAGCARRPLRRSADAGHFDALWAVADEAGSPERKRHVRGGVAG